MHAARRGAGVWVVPNLALDVDVQVGVTRDHGSAGDLDLALPMSCLRFGEHLDCVCIVLGLFRRSGRHTGEK